jgi:hypothetical protein
MKSAILMFTSLLALFFAAQMSAGLEERRIWPADFTTITDLEPMPATDLAPRLP